MLRLVNPYVPRPRSLFGLPVLTVAVAFAFGFATAFAQVFEFTNFRRLANGETQLQLSGPAGQLYRIDTATHLPHWEGWRTFQGTGLNTHTDTAAPFLAQRHYRAEQVAGPDILTGDHLPTAAGDVVIHPMYHATFVMKWNGLTIYNDPDILANYSGLPLADLILVSHDHGDHFDQTALGNIDHAGTVIVAPQVVYNAMNTTLRGLTTVMGNGSSNEILGIMIQAVPAHNSRHAVGSGNGYVLTIGGKNLYMSGDTGPISEMRALRNIDVAFLCMNIPFTMSVTEAASAVRDFRPKVLYPYHYRNEGNTFANFIDLKSQIGPDAGVELRLRNWY